MTALPPRPPEPPPPSLSPSWAAPVQPAATGAPPTAATLAYPPSYPAAGAAGFGARMSPDGAWAWNGYQWVPTFAGYAPPVRPYRTLGSVSSLVIVALLVGVAGSAVAAGSFVHRHSVLEDPGFNLTDAQNADNFVTGAVGVWAAIVVLACIPFLIWLHRAAANLPALGARELRFSPRWAVGWWFVPLANYVMPVAVLVEVWKASDPGAPPTTDRALRRALAVDALVPVWWLLWSGGNLVLTFARSATDNSAALDAPDPWRAVGFAAIAAAGILAAVLVRTVTARQDARARTLAEGRLAP